MAEEKKTDDQSLRPSGMSSDPALLDDFVRVLRASLNVSSLYPPEHPSFKKSAEELRDKINEVLASGITVTIGVMPDRLVIAGREFAGAASYGELAASLHQRKIKSVSFFPGITSEELAIFLSAVTFSPKDIAKQGGINSLLNRYSLHFVAVDDLDYQDLLEGGAGDSTQVWHYLLEEVMAKNDKQAAHNLVKQMVKDFKGAARRLGMSQLLEDEETSQNVNRFLDYLSHNDKTGFRECVSGIAETALNDRSKELDQTQVAKLRRFFRNCTDEDFAAILSGELVERDGLDMLSLSLFSRLAEGRNHADIAALTVDMLKKEPLSSGDKIAKRVEKLFSGEAAADLPGTYRTSLMLFLQNASFGSAQSLDREVLEGNYFYMLLNLLTQERDPGRAAVITGKLESDWSKIIAAADTDYVHSLVDIMESRRISDYPLPKEITEQLGRLVVSFVEELIWDDNFQDTSLLEMVSASTKGPDFYLHKIFEEGVMTSCALNLFIGLFPEEMDGFYARLRLKSEDIGFLDRLISSLETTGVPAAQKILQDIYGFSNIFLRKRILEAMSTLRHPDDGFLLRVLEAEEDVSLKRETLVMLAEEGKGEMEAARILFGIPSPWGKKNNLLIANITAAQEASFKAAVPSLELLSRRPFFWNAALRRRASEALRYLR